MNKQIPGITRKSFEYIQKVLQSFPEIEEAILFGSRAIGNYRKGSDLDIVLKGEKVNERLALKLSLILNERVPIPYFVDILSYYDISNPDIKDHIDRVGKVIYKRKVLAKINSE